jgi:uncharacterized protein YfiM (DUF2279 family)
LKRGRVIALVAAILVAVPVVLMIETSAAVPVAGAPSAAQVGAGRAAFQRLRGALAGPPPATTVAFSGNDLGDIAALVGNAARVDRVAAGVADGAARGAVSIGLPMGLWINLRVAAMPSAVGFPPIRAQIGDLPVPEWMVRAGGEMAVAVLRRRGADLPPLDQLVQAMAVSGDRMTLLVKSPINDDGVIQKLAAVVTNPADPARTAAIYCVLAQQQQAAPSNDLAVQLARAVGAGDPATPAAAVAENRAMLVAVSMLTVGESAGQMAGHAARLTGNCSANPGRIELAGRTDLSKHWSLSAAIGATAGGDIGEAMGNWKELSDSLAGGSGFSFVDLAADRAGLGVGRAAIDPDRAMALRAALRTADNAALLPLDARSMAEGLTNAEFVARYGDIESDGYRAKLAKIDALLRARGTLGS